MTPERHARLGAVLDRRQPDLTVLMDNVHKPHNLAAVARSCDAVGVGVVHGVGEDAEIRLRQKSASGSAGWLEVVMHEGLDAALAAVRAQGMRVVAAHWSDRAVGFRDYDYTRPTALLLGAELDGVSAHAAEVADAHVTIPMLGMVRSLNVSVAAALILFEAQRQREAAGLYARP
jgi:tRNA (guanosine-2'-O-)-methyltransferase